MAHIQGYKSWLAGCGLLMLGVLAVLPQMAQADDSCKKMLATGNPEYPPFFWRDPADDSRLIGANADLMQALSKEINVPIEVRYVGPWARVQEEAKAGRVDLISGAFYTLPRLEYMDYFYPAFHQTRTVIWTKKGSTLSYRKWQDLIGKNGVTVINNSFGEEFDKFARQSLKITTVASLEQAITMLDRGRVDYLIYEEAPGLAYAARMNVVDLKSAVVPITNENLFLTLSHKSPCNTSEMRAKVAKAVYKIYKSGLMDKLLDSNIQLWRKQQSAK